MSVAGSGAKAKKNEKKEGASVLFGLLLTNECDRKRGAKKNENKE